MGKRLCLCFHRCWTMMCSSQSHKALLDCTINICCFFRSETTFRVSSQPKPTEGTAQQTLQPITQCQAAWQPPQKTFDLWGKSYVLKTHGFSLTGDIKVLDRGSERSHRLMCFFFLFVFACLMVYTVILIPNACCSNWERRGSCGTKKVITFQTSKQAW